jgi:hypothetical protein
MTSLADDATEQSEERSPETGLLVYGVVAVGTEVPAVPGLDEAVLRAVQHEELAAVVSDYTLDRRSGRGREVRAFGTVLEALNAAGTVVPVRFGTVLPDEDAVVTELLAPRAEQLRASLDDLTGRSQFTVRAHYLEQVVLSEVVAENPEVAALRQATRELPEDAAYGERVRLGELVARAIEAKQAQDVEALLGPVLEHATDHVLRQTSGLERLLDVAVLVDEARRDDFEASLESLAEAVHERIRVQLLGPTPPYDFVTEA